MSSHLEVERTFAPPSGAELPDLTAADGVDAVEDHGTVDLAATYFDTEDLSLSRAGVSLRRREGGADAGWHLKVPAERGRHEISQPLGRATRTPPAVLRRAVLGWSRGRDLIPVAEIRTRRATHRLRDRDGRVLAELADDRVVGTTGNGAEPVSWREWEVELVDGGPDVLTVVAQVLDRCGVASSPVQRKIDHVLALPPATVDLDEDSAGCLLHRRLTEQVALLRLHDSGIRRGVPDSVHQTRVTCRRLRAALATFRPLLDRTVTDPIREELRWVTHALGEARDAEVMHERLRGLVNEEPFVEGPVRSRLRSTYLAREREAKRVVDAAMASERYFALLRSLEDLVSDPPWTDRAHDDARKLIKSRIRAERRRLGHRVEAAYDVPDLAGSALDIAVHDARKAAKRFRYAWEAAVPLLGEEAENAVTNAGSWPACRSRR